MSEQKGMLARLGSLRDALAAAGREDPLTQPGGEGGRALPDLADPAAALAAPAPVRMQAAAEEPADRTRQCWMCGGLRLRQRTSPVRGFFRTSPARGFFVGGFKGCEPADRFSKPNQNDPVWPAMSTGAPCSPRGTESAPALGTPPPPARTADAGSR